MIHARTSELASLDDLKALSIAELSTWLRDAARRWGKDPDARTASSSFFPIIISMDTPFDLGEVLGRRLAVAFDNETRKPGEAVVSAIEGWRLLADGQEGAAILIRAASELSANRLFDALDALISKFDASEAPYTEKFSDALATAAVECLSRDRALEIGALARRMNLMAPADAARILAYVSTGRLERLGSFAELLRLPSEADAHAADWLVTLLLASHNAEEIRFALSPALTGAPKASAVASWVLDALHEVADLPTSPVAVAFEIIDRQVGARAGRIRRIATGITTEDLEPDVNPNEDASDFARYTRSQNAPSVH